MSAIDPSAQSLPLAGGGGAGVPTATGADQVPVSTGAGTTYVATDLSSAVLTGLDGILGAQPAGTAPISDGAGGTKGTSSTVAALLNATRLSFDQVVNAVEHTTNNGSTYHLLTISCATGSRAYTFRGTVSAAKSDYSNAYAWDIIATVSHDGAVTLRGAVITPTDPSGPYTVSCDINGSNLRVAVNGVAATNVKWHGGGFLTVYGA